MARFTVATAENLRARLSGRLLFPNDPGYDALRRVWNGRIDRRPALIVRCANADDIAEAIRFARDHDVEASVRGGGHNIAGNSVCDDGIVIDLSGMKGIIVDPTAQIARAEPGLLLREFEPRPKPTVWRRRWAL